MSLPRWDDEMKFELLRLKSELRPESFRVLHTPMGIGVSTKRQDTPNPRGVHLPHLTKSTQRLAGTSPEAKHPSVARSPKASEQKRSEPKAKLNTPVAVAPLPTKKFSNRWPKLLLVHALDLAFVLLTLGLGLLLANWFIDPKNFSANPGVLKQAFPLQLLIKSHGFKLLLGLYAFFSVYWLFFKLVTGSTLGESFFGNIGPLQNPRDTAPVKDSSDS